MKLTFSKYKGLTFDEVIKKDPRFARWFLRTFRGTSKDTEDYLLKNTDELLCKIAWELKYTKVYD